MPRKVSFALPRDQFIQKIVDTLEGALGEHYKIVVGEIIGKTNDISHWKYEVESHFNVVSRILVKPTKTKFDKRKALQQAIYEVRLGDLSTRNWAIHHLQGEKYKYSVPKSVTAQHPSFEPACDEFYARAWGLADQFLGV